MEIVYPQINYLITNEDNPNIRPFAIGESFIKKIDRNDERTGMGKIFLNSYSEGILNTNTGYGVLGLKFTIRNDALKG